MGSEVEKCHLRVRGHQKTAGENVDRDLILDQNEGPDLDRTLVKGKSHRNKIYLMNATMQFSIIFKEKAFIHEDSF